MECPVDPNTKRSRSECQSEGDHDDGAPSPAMSTPLVKFRQSMGARRDSGYASSPALSSSSRAQSASSPGFSGLSESYEDANFVFANMSDMDLGEDVFEMETSMEMSVSGGPDYPKTDLFGNGDNRDEGESHDEQDDDHIDNVDECNSAFSLMVGNGEIDAQQADESTDQEVDAICIDACVHHGACASQPIPIPRPTAPTPESSPNRRSFVPLPQNCEMLSRLSESVQDASGGPSIQFPAGISRERSASLPEVTSLMRQRQQEVGRELRRISDIFFREYRPPRRGRAFSLEVPALRIRIVATSEPLFRNTSHTQTGER
ncbi:hypothetical protein MAR_002045 [Mya arenaria]|uniref:Uncharacterized protein n=1 Tax=Mya arenaria TaxID=6604 RepID=A0ABY7FF47_MYAAR|nr:uncharacterized protein LOC128207469 [Mya arenaria]XP_052766368.1 uncharacterized protein LOC128207469 [Mya arenaria]XP_052766369.1 uncharacterized protein LOC128207469 [Mya arenaria]XP_052766370.1 uncharacterized protein LOC128207469 [Mya arenaria]WAR20207.1 hypothetical protein MAR_002045 [Mya arenaria]